MAPARLRPLRPLGIAYFFCFPLTSFSLWITLGALAALVFGFVQGQWVFPALLTAEPLAILNGGCCVLPSLLPEPLQWIGFAAPPVLVLLLVGALFRRIPRAAQVAKWTALLSLPASLLTIGGAWHRVHMSMSWSAEQYRFEIVIAFVCVALPLIWHLFVLWYLRGYPWRRQKAAASSQPSPTPE